MPKDQFKVPLIHQDVSHEETVLQIAFSLDCLQAAVESVFVTIEDRIKKGQSRLQDLQKRCQHANEKVMKIKGITKSITVYSSAKYPVPRQNLFFDDVEIKVQVEKPDIRIKYTPLPANKLSLKEKMKFYHVKDSTQLLRKNEEVTPFEGLGALPENLKTISSVLLFNTSENLYDNYKLIDPLAVPKQTNLNIRQDNKPEIEPAPASLLSYEPLGLKNVPNYFYNPISQDAPEINAPLDLPHLSGIAGDLRYDEDVSYEKEVKETIPKPSRLEITEDKVTLVQELPKLEESSPMEAMSPPPPPPPPPPPIPEPDPSAYEVVNEGPRQRPAVSLISEPDSSTTEATHPPPPPIVPDARANLMEAIRQAGGKAKLKSVQTEESKISRKGAPMSLMEDLHDKLLMRRKGILGKTDAAEGNILEHVATMIPPPPKKQQESEEEDDQEWDD